MTASMAELGGARAAILAVLVLCFAITTFAVPIAPNKSWCKTTSSQKKYAIFPSGKCALCDFIVPGPNHCDSRIGQVCPEGPPYQIITSGAYRRCVCGKSWYGSPRGDKLPADVTVGLSPDAGCTLCPVFPTSSKPGAASTAAQCNVCRASLLYSGTGPFCSWTPTKFANAKCEIPGRTTPGAKIPKTNACGCKPGYTGVWPECKACPLGLSNTGVGNNKKCNTCDASKGYVADTKTKSLSCVCNNAKGYYLSVDKAVKECQLCSKVPGGAVVSTKSGKRCGCDATQGYGRSLAANDAVTLPVCIKCADKGAVLDKASGFCKCKPGFAVQPLLFAADTPYCAACNAKGYKINGQGICSCAAGYARAENAFDHPCIPCSGGNKQTFLRDEHPQPVCDCQAGYEGNIFEASAKCTKCAPGLVSNPGKPFPGSTLPGSKDDFCRCKDPRANPRDSGCVCPIGYTLDPKTQSCKLTAECKASRWVGRFWNSQAIGSNWNATFFPSSVITKKVTPTKTVAYNSLKLSVAQGDLPAGKSFAAVFDGVFLGGKAVPYFLPDGKFQPGMTFVSQSTKTPVVIVENTDFLTPDPPVGIFTADPTLSYLQYNSNADTCANVTIYWWGNSQGATLKVQIMPGQNLNFS